MANQNQKTISWQAHEFRHYPKNTGWYITLIAVAVLVIAFFIIIEKDVFAAVCLALLTILIIIFSRQVPQRVHIELEPTGIKFGRLFYPYKQLKYFWVVNNENHKTVNFHTSALVNNLVILELEHQDPEAVRNFLLKHLAEHSETEETSVQKVMHRLKF